MLLVIHGIQNTLQGTLAECQRIDIQKPITPAIVFSSNAAKPHFEHACQTSAFKNDWRINMKQTFFKGLDLTSTLTMLLAACTPAQPPLYSGSHQVPQPPRACGHHCPTAVAAQPTRLRSRKPVAIDLDRYYRS
jgi:hypothetical protein